MGFYDCRCMATGVSLKGAEAALVLLRQSGDRYAPLALAVKGNYDRLGSIDGIEEDDNTRLLLSFFLERLRSGAFAVDEASLRIHECFPIRTVEDLLRGFERNMNDGGRAVLDGQPVVFALIARAVWDAVARAAPRPAEPLPDLFRRLFAASPITSEIYAGSLDEVSDQVEELAAVDSFLAGRGLIWRPTEAGGQDSREEMREYLDEARQTFADSPTVLKGLLAYEREVGELLEGD